MFTFRGIFGSFVLMVLFLWGTIWITSLLPSKIDSDQLLTSSEADFIRKLTIPVVANAAATFDCSVKEADLAKTNLALLEVDGDATVVALRDMESSLFVFWLRGQSGSCELTAIAAVSEPSAIEGHFQVNEWNRTHHLSVLFYDLEEKMIVHRAVASPKTLEQALEVLRKFTEEIHEFQTDIVGAYDRDNIDV